MTPRCQYLRGRARRSAHRQLRRRCKPNTSHAYCLQLRTESLRIALPSIATALSDSQIPLPA